MVRTVGRLLLLCVTVVFPIACTGWGDDDISSSAGPQPSAPSSFPAFLTPMSGVLYFSADDGVRGNELWRSDGTAAGTFLVKDINPGSGDSSPSGLVVANGVLFFAANNGVQGVELWKSDGTEAGTMLVKDVRSGSSSSTPGDLTAAVNGTLFFTADDGTFGIELWKSDGTEGGTVRVRDINFGAANSTPSVLLAVDPLVFNTDLFFVADDGANGRELWRSNGTDSGTVIVKDINPTLKDSNDISLGTEDSSPSSLTVMNGEVFFAAYDGPVRGRELWKSDGTLAGTVLVKDINTDTAVENGYSFPSFLTNVNGTLFFSANDGIHKVGLWKSDGTDAGSSWIMGFNPQGTDPGPLYFLGMNGTLFFQANNAICGGVFLCGVELWSIDGTGAGTAQVKDINPATEGDSGPSFLTPVNANIFFFTAFDGPASAGGDHGVELWKSDGTEAGTCLVKDVWPGTTTSNPFGLTAMNGAMFFTADDGVNGVELWRSEGTDTGTACDQATGTSTRLVLNIRP